MYTEIRTDKLCALGGDMCCKILLNTLDDKKNNYLKVEVPRG